MKGKDTPQAEPRVGSDPESEAEAIERVRGDAARLVKALEDAAGALKTPGHLPGDELILGIRNLRSAFQAVWVQLERSAAAAGAVLDAQESPLSLGQLKSAEEEITRALGDRSKEAELSRVTRLARQAAALESTEGEDALLADVKTVAGRLIERFASDEANEIVQQAPAPERALAALLRLVESGQTLSDEEWMRGQAAVAEAFSPELATAAARGRIVLGEAEELEPPGLGEVPVEEEIQAGAGDRLVGSEERAGVVPERASESLQTDDSVASTADGESQGAADASNDALTAEVAAEDGGSERLESERPLSGPSASLEESAEAAMGPVDAVQMAARAINASGPDRAQQIEQLIWRLIADGRAGLARGLERALPREGDFTGRRLPHWLLSAVLLGSAIREPAGAIAHQLEAAFQEFGDDCFLEDQAEWNGVVRLLLVSAAIQPAILAPATGAPALLHSVRLGESDLHELSTLCELIAGFGDHGQPLDPNCIKDVTAQVDWRDRLAGVRAEAREWCKEAPRYTMVYAPATQVWKRWLEPGGRLVELLEPVMAHEPERAEWLRIQCDTWWENEAEIDRAVQRTFSSMKGRKRGLRIEARALRAIVSHVSKAVEIARRWLATLDAQPERAGDYVREQAKRLRSEVLTRRQRIDDEVGLWKGRQHGDELARVAAAQCLKSALDSVCALFEHSSAFSFRECEPQHLLSRELLLYTPIRLDESWEPSRAAESTTEILRNIAEPPRDWGAAFDSRIEGLDLEGSARIIEVLEREADDESLLDGLHEKQAKAERDARDAFNRDLQETRIAIERALASGLLRETERNELSARIENLDARMVESLEYAGARLELEDVRARVDATRHRELSLTRQRLDQLQLAEEDAARVRILDALNRGDAWTAHEYLDRIERGDTLPSPKQDRRSLADFWPDRARQIAGDLQERKLRRLRHAIGTRGEFGGLNFASFETKELDRARELVKAWENVKKTRQRVEPASFRALLQELGFEESQIDGDKIENTKQYTWVPFRATPIAERRVIPVAHFGSKAGGRYRALCVWNDPSDDTLVRWVGDTAHGAPVIIFYFGVLTERKRRGLTRQCLEQHRTFIVIDEVLMSLLAAERGSRLPVLFLCSLPFTWLEPFATTAGLVPPEMFYGRSRERTEIQNREGSCFIYGGRQLGKTALLKDVERNFYDAGAGRVARYLDLKREGIGYDRSATDLWELIARELKRSDVLPSSAREQSRPERIGEAVVRWLEAEPDRRVLLLLDEADEFLDADGRDGWRCSTQLKGLMDETERRFKVVFAGLHNVLRSVRSANHPLAHYGHAICIGPLVESGEWGDASELIQMPMETMGFLFESNDLVTRILSQTNYFPSLLQLYGQQLLRKVADPRGLVFNDRTSPPSMVSGEAIDDAYQNTREAIRQRVQWTLQLDPRYEVLAYALALESAAARQEATAGFSVQWFREEALLWWSAGFDGERGTYDAVHAILDEMVGLGVLREATSGRYGFRSPNVISLLGTQVEIEKQLERDRDAPIEYAPSRFRRPDPNDPVRRSPLSVEQEETLRSGRDGVSVVCGWEMAGLEDLPVFLRTRFSPDMLYELPAGSALGDLQERAEAIAQKNQPGTHLIFVSHDCEWTTDWVQWASNRCNRLRSRERFMRVLFAAGPSRVWHLLNQSGDDTLPLGSEIDQLTLRPWSDEALRQWLEDAGIPLGPSDRQAIASSSGSWPAGLYAMRSVLLEGGDPSRVVSEVNERAIALARSSSAVRELQGLPEVAGVVKAIAEWGEPLGPDELEALVGNEKRELATRVVRWGEILGLVTSDSAGAWRLDPTFASAIVIME